MSSIREAIREVRKGDHARLTRFFQRNDVPEVTQYFHPFPLNATSAEAIACGSTSDAYLAACAGDEIVGLCMLRGWDEGYEVPSFGILIDSNHRGNGTGRRLAQQGLLEARRRGSERVRLTVYASNKPALELFRSLGFYETERMTQAHDRPHEERLVMMLDLRQSAISR